jgi:uncharacterized repeat protein (TIGR04052 family)
MQVKTLISLAALIAASTIAVAPRSLAHAHADLVSAEPAVNSTISEAPKQLRLVFDEKLVAAGMRVSLTDAAGVPLRLGKGAIDPADAKAFIVPVDASAVFTSGRYTVKWTALAEDGHRESGSYRFTFAASTATVAAPKTGAAGTTTLRFALKVGAEPVVCGKDIAKLGKNATGAQLIDARLHVGNIRLIDASGKETPAQLIADGKWQSDKVALLDFENATGLCREGGTAETRSEVTIKAPTGKFVGVVFDMGLPFELNHADVAAAKAPLNVAAMWWNWQFGYKFARIDLKTKSPAPRDAFLIHLGSTGCGAMAMEKKPSMDTTKAMTDTAAMTMTKTMTGTKAGHGAGMDMSAMNKPPAKPCANPNVVTVRLDKFDAAKEIIVADLDGLLKNVDIANPSPQPAGCMSGIEDADCSPLFANFGLSLKSGLCENACQKQTFFRVEAAPVR